MQNVKGTYDYFGEKQALRRKVQSVLREIFELYDYEEMDTAILNELELLTSKYAGGEEILKEMYRLSDQGERKIGLRYDLTIPFAKVVALNPGLEFPYRRYEIGKVFRDGPVKRGRLREFLQCDADVVGIEGPEAEAELMQLAVDVFRRLEIPVWLRWNNRRFLGEVLEAIGVPVSDTLSVMLTLDKIEKIGMDGVKEELVGKGLDSQATKVVLELIRMEKPTFEQVASTYGVATTPGALEVLALQNLLQQIGLEQSCVFDPFLSRGLSFYTGTMYEIFDASNTFASSLAGGGRYDSIIGQLVGREDIRYPTVGLSFGMESIMELLKNRAIELPCASAAVIPVGEMLPVALKTAAELRAKGIRTRVEKGGRKLRKILSTISSKGIRYVILIGENEGNLGKVRLKDMAEETESVLTVQEAVNRIIKS